MKTKKMQVYDDVGPYGTAQFSWDHDNPQAMTILWTRPDGAYLQQEFLFELLFAAEMTLKEIGVRGVSEIMFRLGSYGCLDIGLAVSSQEFYLWVCLREHDTMQVQRFLREVQAKSLVRQPLISADLDRHLQHILASS